MKVCERRGSSLLFFSFLFLHACHSAIKQLKILPHSYPAAVAHSDCDRHKAADSCVCVSVNMHEATVCLLAHTFPAISFPLHQPDYES